MASLLAPVVQTQATEAAGHQSQPSHHTAHVAPFIHPTHVQYEDDREKRNASLQVSWSDWMSDAQRNSSVYKRIAVLLISWHQDCDDLKVGKEVAKLKEVFAKRYNYQVSEMKLDIHSKIRPQVQVNQEVANFVAREDGEHTLLIVYYAGHGSPGMSPGHLKLSGQIRAYAPDLYHIVWNYTEGILQDTHSDVLEIFDCCYAGDLGRSGCTTRSFEFLGATSSSSTTPSPGERSFTSALIWALEDFADQPTPQKFTMTELANKIREAPHFPREQVPSLIARHPPSAQRIVLAALPREGESEPVIDEPTRMAPECLELRFYFEREPDDYELKELSSALSRYIKLGEGSLYRVSFGGLYSVVQNAARRWKKLIQSHNWRSGSLSSLSTYNHVSPIMDSQSSLGLGTDSSQETLCTACRTSTTINDNYQNEAGQLSIFYHVKMVWYSIWAAILPTSNRVGTLMLV